MEDHPPNLAFYLSNRREAILEGYLQLAEGLPAGKWLFVRPWVARDDRTAGGWALDEPDWYGWRNAPWKLFAQFRFLLGLRSLVVRRGVRRVFHYGIPSAWSFLLSLLLTGTRARLVLYVHDPKTHPGEAFKQRLVNGMSERLLMRKSGALIASYEGGRQILLERGLIAPGRIHVARLPMLDRMGAEGGKGIPSDLLFFGRLEAYKGLDMLGVAMEILAARGERPRLLVLGRGPARDVVARMATDHPNVEHVEDFLSNADLAATVRSTRLVVLPYREATGSQIVQIANHHGIPVVATDAGAFPEHVVNGVNGTIVPPGDPVAFVDAVLDWLGKPREEVARACRSHAVAHDDPAVFAETVDRIVEGCGD